MKSYFQDIKDHFVRTILRYEIEDLKERFRRLRTIVAADRIKLDLDSR